jgi:hypothetical protein
LRGIARFPRGFAKRFIKRLHNGIATTGKMERVGKVGPLGIPA